MTDAIGNEMGCNVELSYVHDDQLDDENNDDYERRLLNLRENKQRERDFAFNTNYLKYIDPKYRNQNKYYTDLKLLFVVCYVYFIERQRQYAIYSGLVEPSQLFSCPPFEPFVFRKFETDVLDKFTPEQRIIISAPRTQPSTLETGGKRNTKKYKNKYKNKSKIKRKRHVFVSFRNRRKRQ